jgi:hypothetical protein
VCPGSQDGFHEPDIGLHVIGDLRQEKGRGSRSKGSEDTHLVGEMPIYGCPALQVV